VRVNQGGFSSGFDPHRRIGRKTRAARDPFHIRGARRYPRGMKNRLLDATERPRAAVLSLWIVGVIGTAMIPACGDMLDNSAAIVPRASFDLACDVQLADVTRLTAVEYHVLACGCRATYHQAATGGFVLNVVSGEHCAATSGGSSR
jgi:hypothetical protein